MGNKSEFKIHFFLCPLEIMLDPNLSEQDKWVFWVIYCICKKKKFCFYTNKELFAFLKIPFPRIHLMTISQSVNKLVRESAITSTVEIIQSGSRRKLQIFPGFKEHRKRFVEEFNKTSLPHTGSVVGLRGISPTTYPPWEKVNEINQVKSHIYNNEKDINFPLGNYGLLHKPTGNLEPTTKQEIAWSSPERRPEDMMTRGVERIIKYWESKEPRLQRSQTKATNKAIPVIKEVLTRYRESTVEKCIDLYHQSLHNPTLMCQKLNNRAPSKVGIGEFFKFSVDTKIFIQANHIKGFEGIDSWFALCLKGEQEINNRFLLVPQDKFPIITSMLKKVISSWDDHPPIVGNDAEKQLRRASCKLVEFHQRVRNRILDWRGATKASVPQFLKENFIPYVLNNLDLDHFRLYWLMSDNFYYNFERYLEDMRAISKPTMVRHQLKRRAGNDQSISLRGGSRAVGSDRYDSERDLSAADF